jgi:hypothetical protein
MNSALHLGAVKRTPELISRIQYFSTDQNLEFRKNKLGFAGALILPLFIAAGLFFIPMTKQKEMPVAAVFAAANSKEVYKSFTTAPIEDKVLNAAYGSYETPVADAEASSPEKNITDQNLSPVLNDLAIPAGFTEPKTADSVKEFIYDVETPKGKVTQSFRVTLVNGQWVYTPQWMTIETTPDSCFKVMPVINVIDSIQ